jgi:hypothetical protein
MVDLTINAKPRTIRLKDVGIRMERPAGGTIKPGSLVYQTSSDTFLVHATAGGNTARIFALENELIGLGIDDNYVVNDYVQAEQFDSGDWVLAYVAASASAIVIGDRLESDGAGGLRKLASGTPLATSMDALDNSGGSAIARIRVAIM